MNPDSLTNARLLVCITSYGNTNDKYLSRIIEEYRSIRFDVEIVVFSNISKEVASGVEVVVGVPNENPWSLPFAHKRVMAERLHDYDLFIYSEDDILIQEKNIQAFLKATKALHEDEIAGFIRSETGPNGEISYCDFHACHHWDCRSVGSRGEFTAAYQTNEHAACYVLTRQQLERAIRSGGFLVGPHHGRQYLPETAATDPYTQCGFKKVVCISHLDDFVVQHLSNRYIGTWMSLSRTDLCRQVKALAKIGADHAGPMPLLETQTRLMSLRYSKSYYEPARSDIASLIPDGVNSLLSIGCGWGAMEESLMQNGLLVSAIPLDPVIGSCAAARGVELIQGGFVEARQKLGGRRFDCLLISNVLHLVERPVEILLSFIDVLSANGVLIVAVPNVSQLPVLWGKLKGDLAFKDLGSFVKTGVHLTSHRRVRSWLKDAGFMIDRFVYPIPPRGKGAHHATFGIADTWLASEIIAVSRRA